MKNIILPSLFDQVGEEEAVQPVKVEEASVEKKGPKKRIVSLASLEKKFSKIVAASGQNHLNVFTEWLDYIIEWFTPFGDMSKFDERKDLLLELTHDYDYSPHSLAVYKTALLDFFSYAADLNTENARRYIQTLHDQGKSVKTINLRITALMRYAKSYNINLSIKRPKCQKTLECENIPSESEYRRILDYLKEHNYKHYLMVVAMATTGARVSELLQFKIDDIIAGEVVLRGKGNKFRKFFFTKEFQVMVKDWVKETGTSGYLCKSRFGDVMTSRGVLEMLKKLEVPCRVKKEKLHPHAFRHFFAKMWLKRNKDVVQLADLLGHGSIDTTRIYLQKTHEEQRRDFNRNVYW